MNMNRIDGKRLSETFFKYYDAKPVEECDVDMLENLLLAKHIKYTIKENKAYAEATDIGKGLHSL